MTLNRVFREYMSNGSFPNPGSDIPEDVKEFQVCLAFAVEKGNGNFTAMWDTKQVSPKVIKEFKTSAVAAHREVKMLVSIGNNTEPFKIDATYTPDQWVSNATKSVQKIINEYQLDGIDVHYMSVDPDPSSHTRFVDCIGKLLQNLEGSGGAKLVASIAPNAVTNDDYYLPLYNNYHSSVSIQTVVYECFINPDASLVSITENAKAKALNYESANYFLLGNDVTSSDHDPSCLPLLIVLLCLLGHKNIAGFSTLADTINH